VSPRGAFRPPDDPSPWRAGHPGPPGRYLVDAVLSDTCLRVTTPFLPGRADRAQIQRYWKSIKSVFEGAPRDSEQPAAAAGAGAAATQVGDSDGRDLGWSESSVMPVHDHVR
jgi:hypothetical protein